MDFKIYRGLSTNLFDENGVCLLSADKLENGAWYITTDTIDVYVCFNGTLEKINSSSDSWDEERVAQIESRSYYERFGSRSVFPPTGELNRIYIANDENEAEYRWNGTEYVLNVICLFGGNADSETDW